MATVFFSYSHVDEGLRDRLEIALSALKRQGLIEAWHDRRLIGMPHIGRGNPEGKLTQEGAGEYLWELLMQPLQWR